MTVAKRDRIACQGTKRVITWKGVVGAENRKERERDGGKRGEKKNWKTEARRKGSQEEGYRKRTKGRKETSPSASIRAPSCTSPSPWVGGATTLLHAFRNSYGLSSLF